MNRFKNKVTVLTGLLKGIEAFVPNSLMKKVFITMVVAFASLGSVHAQDPINQDTTALNVANRFFDRFKSGATPEAVVLGNLESLSKRNESVMKSEFTIDIVVDSGLITRYHLLEDSFEISRAVNAKKTKSKK
jgi:hypothetical protein